MASPAVAQDAVSTATAFIVIPVVLSIALRRRLSKLPRLLVDAAAWNTTYGVRIHLRAQMMPSLTRRELLLLLQHHIVFRKGQRGVEIKG